MFSKASSAIPRSKQHVRHKRWRKRADKNQLFYFCLCILVGFAGGLPYEIFVILRRVFRCERGKSKTLGVILDVIFPIFFAVICVFMQFILRFPNFRAYMWIGYAAGWIIYLKTLRKLVAFFKKICYNQVSKLIKSFKKVRKNSPNREEEHI